MVTVSKFYSRTIRQGAVPSNPGNVDQPDAIPPVLNPPGSNPSPAVEHNNTLNKQGGQEDEYYHLTEDQLEGLQELLSPPDIDRISQIGTITFNTSTSISADDWKAIFSGVELDDTPLTLDPVTGTPTDYSRIDSVYYKPDGTIGYETGAEDPDGAQFPPSIPDGTIRMADILRGTDGSNVIDYIDLQLDDFVSKSDTLLQTIQSNLAIAPLSGTEPNYTVLAPNGQLYRSRTDQAGIYSTLQGSGGYSRILTINLNVPAQLNYYSVIEFHGISTNFEKGFLWVQFQVDSSGDMVTNALKCFGEFDVSKYTLVKVDSDHYDLFVSHDEANSFYKFRPLANFGGSSIYTYYQLPAKVNPLPGGDDFGFSLYVAGITGSGTTNEIAYFTGAKTIGSLAVATYPSLAELAYVKGVTSAIQNQLNNKQATISGTLTNGHVATIVAGVPTWQAPSGGGISDAPNDGLAYTRKSLAWTQLSPYDLKQEGAANGARLTWVSANSRYEPTLTGDWTLVTGAPQGDYIYYPTRIIAGDTAFPSTDYDFYFRQRPLSASGSLNFQFFVIANRDGTEIFKIGQNSGLTLTVPLITTSRIWAGSITTNANTGSNHIEGFAVSTGVALRLTNNSGTIIADFNNNGSIVINSDFILGTTTGTKIGTATSQKLSFWNKTPIIQPTTAITAAAFVANTSGIANDTATYGGYTMGQIAAALINTGILA